MKYLDNVEYSESSPSGLIWKTRISNRIKVGDVCGSIAIRNGKKYYETNILGIRYYCHRLVWEIFNGKIPKNKVLDHIDKILVGDVCNNKINNLQLLDNHNNVRKSNIRINNTSGITGVRFDKNRSKWVSEVKILNNKYAKRFSNIDDAISYRKDMLEKHGAIQ